MKLSLPKSSSRESVSDSRFTLLGGFVVVVLVAIGTSVGLFDLRTKTSIELPARKKSLVENPIELRANPEVKLNESVLEPLTIENPNEVQIQSLLDAWLTGKASVLAGGKSKGLSIVAREVLVSRVQLERKKDGGRDESQIIKTTIISMKVVSQTLKRIEVKAKLAYSDQRVNSSGETVSETSIPSLKVTYVLGREKDLWQLVDYISGS